MEEVTVACSYIACHNGSLTLLDVEYIPPCQSTEHSTTCLFSQDFNSSIHR
ncbi:hypothetical protein HMPREF9551_01905 [Escherichia coli MS 196-1]|nr:hypothetical protein HMPREF9551_01905 [Escherichia coli MS 196-1]